MSRVEVSKVGRATIMALAKFGEITVSDESWGAFVEEVGANDMEVAQALHDARFAGYCSFTIVEHPCPPSPYLPWTRRYVYVAGKTLADMTAPLIDADEETERMLAKQATLKPSDAVLVGAPS